MVDGLLSLVSAMIAFVPTLIVPYYNRRLVRTNIAVCIIVFSCEILVIDPDKLDDRPLFGSLHFTF